MPDPTKIELNPPNGGAGGWGNPEDRLQETTLYEKRMSEANADDGLYKDVRELVVMKGDKSPLEQRLIDESPYDDGYDLDFADLYLYNGVPYVNQNPKGTCVGAGAASAIASKVSTEILLEGDNETPFGDKVSNNKQSANTAAPCVDFHYGAGKMRQYWDEDDQRFTKSMRLGDGSYCAAQIWALKTVGVLPCSEVQGSGHEFPQTRAIRANAGNVDQFLNKHVAAASLHRMGDSVRVETGDELSDVITILHQPCMICSGWGFRPKEQVDGLGWVYKRSGSWPHNMTLVACVEVGGNWYVKVRNQWGPDAHRDGWHFWITLELADKWLRSAECQSIGELQLNKAGSDSPFTF